MVAGITHTKSLAPEGSQKSVTGWIAKVRRRENFWYPDDFPR